jgi:hypothetical protein
LNRHKLLKVGEALRLIREPDETGHINVVSLLERGFVAVGNVLVFGLGQEVRQLLEGGSNIIKAEEKISKDSEYITGSEDLLVVNTALVAWVGKHPGYVIRRELIFTSLFQHTNRGQVSENAGWQPISTVDS